MKINAINQKLTANDERYQEMMRANGFGVDQENAPKILHQFGPVESIGDLDAPNGERWYYTGAMEYDVIPPHDDVIFPDYILQTYEFTIYNAQFEKVGVIKDKVRYAENEKRAPLCELAPVVSRNFFNDDDRLEFVVGIGVNYTDKYGVNYRSLVYQIDGKKDSDGNDEPIMIIPSLIGDVIEGPMTVDGKDNFYMTFSEDGENPLGEEAEYWERVSSNFLTMKIYGSSRGTGAPRELFKKDIKLLNLPGDQQYTPFMFSLLHNGEVFLVQSEYSEPFYNDYHSADEDLSMRDGNKLNIYLYKLEETGVTTYQTTSIDVVKDAEAETLASYYSVGSMRYREDVDFDHYEKDHKTACFIITKSNYVVGSDDSYVNSYYVYAANGKRGYTLFENCESTVSLSNLPGKNPVQIFAVPLTTDYKFTMVDIITNRKLCTISSQYYIEEYEDTEALYANVDRVAVGDEFYYVFELRYPTIDDDDNDVMRFMWLKSDGSFDHIDYVNMGQNVNYAQGYITNMALDPKFFDSDDQYEYMLLAKRSVTSTTTQEELIIGKVQCEDYPLGKTLLHVTPDSELGVLSYVSPVVNDGRNMLMIGFNNNEAATYTTQFYDLPLDGSGAGIDSIVADDCDNAVQFDGVTVMSTGLINIYTMAGALVAQGVDSYNTSALPAGLYIVSANNSTAKISIK